MDDSIARNLDTQHRRLAELEADLDRLLAGDLDLPAREHGGGPQGYAALTEANDKLRARRGWDVVDIDAAIPSDLHAEYCRWRGRQRRPWGLDDVCAVACAGLVGIGATWFDATIDRAVRDVLRRVKETPLVRGWERDARRMPLDHMGPGFGGLAHRVRSAGHDLTRPFDALDQIRTGQFRGFTWEDGRRIDHAVDDYTPVTNLGDAATLWAKHLIADVITPMSLPLPGWSRLYELPVRDLRKFAHDTYAAGANLRSASLQTLPVLSTEIIIRTHVHGRALLHQGSATLGTAEMALRTELLLAAHSLTGAAALGKALTLSFAVSPAAGFWHVNWPVLVRAAMLALQVQADAAARRCTPVAEWDALLSGAVHPWQLITADELDRAIIV